MILCDSEIEKYMKKRHILIAPYNKDNLQPNSYDVTLDDGIIVNGVRRSLPYTIRCGDFVLASTKEHIEINKKCCAMVDGKSTLARHGLQVHLTAGFIDCGFRGNVTLEMINSGNPYTLNVGMPIGQLIFFKSKTPRIPYHGHYQNQNGVTEAYDRHLL